MTRERRSIPAPAPDFSIPNATTKTASTDLGCQLTAAQQVECTTRARALARDRVKKAPAHLDARFLHMGQIAARAVDDAGQLVGLDLDGAPITRAEIDALEPAIEHARECNERLKQNRATRRAAAPAGAPADDSSPKTLAAMRAEIVGLQRKLMDAFRLRYRKDPSQLDAARRAMKRGAAASVQSATTQVLALCNRDGNMAWLRALRHGEADAAARLDALSKTFARRLKAGDGGAVRAATDERDRAWTVAHDAVERVRAAGRYLVSDDPARKNDYRPFESVRVSRAKKNKAPPAPPSPPENKNPTG